MTALKDSVQRAVRRYADVFRAFTPGQKVTAILGTAALLFGAVLLYGWVSAPQYAPLFTNMSPKDASAVVAKLDAQGTKYQISGGGGTILVPQDEVYKDRIALSGDGLPSGADGGYSLLDNQSLSTSDFQQQVTYKRAMEGELSKTLGAMDGVSAAVVHLALPSKQVFSDTQDPTTASVLLDVKPGVTLDDTQVQAVVHLVASSIDGLDPAKVTVADQAGHLLSSPTDAGAGGLAAATRDKQTTAFEAAQTQRIQAILDRVVGPGNGTVQVSADLNYDQATSSSTTYKKADPNGLSTSQTTTSEDYKGAGGTGAGSSGAGIVGPDGQLQTGSVGTTGTSSGQSTYSKKSATSDQALDTTVTNTVVAPGTVKSLHVGIVLDQRKVGSVDVNALQQSIASAVGYDTKRGDTMSLAQLPFDRSSEKAAAAELAAQTAADQQAQLMGYVKTGLPVLLLAVLLLVGWLRARKRAKAREEATEYVVGQLREEAALRAAMARDLADAAPARDRGVDEDEALRRELESLVEGQPEDVASLLRGWLVERPS
ncbi:flagellar basal-body MS-ring/collar protein FliF [Lapillicoccus jejuensis]|uniref:Flagellar M-ring protein n=1 Tax=Lapillicoccus jejuensis TaxID=402171 RepID=A0A542E4G0_9MICO|nr:flagellar basal-body MS-ring/collar protein FliF [Lapillicoccus jejuensis]TQJ10166.1 flagellar M-ring protein FliF [Lapillicoccus jejuensis]